ncbi:rhamnan synthesis F family protein, partial [Pseudomonas urmiensis]|uniref:rhamnan synthesis F family protein n=1 Tax=Pseudomonas urmiensis TaxID=2745493 RepID=UPI0034D63806
MYSPHIQSYFLSIAKSVFNATFWRDFIYSVKHEEHKTDIIINYEMGMSKLLSSHGYP